MSCRCNREIMSNTHPPGFSSHTTPQSTTNFAMKTTSQHSDVIYQTKAKGMLYTYWHSFIVLVFVYIDITCIVVREATLEKLKRTFRFVSAGSRQTRATRYDEAMSSGIAFDCFDQIIHWRCLCIQLLSPLCCVSSVQLLITKPQLSLRL